ncbi:unnamed protein product [Protopolystoma xenopodis]|uniref:Uncharacterized protein n=1 Tax=Protopolystoma xenopodis TaxID=117903 RepID=A0A3S5CGV3_9PLAT|nr:unnamed protein product [Protopolystoma xenopodis]
MVSILSTVIASFIIGSASKDTKLPETGWRIALCMAAGVQLLAGVVYLIFASCEEQPWSTMPSHNYAKQPYAHVPIHSIDALASRPMGESPERRLAKEQDFEGAISEEFSDETLLEQAPSRSELSWQRIQYHNADSMCSCKFVQSNHQSKPFSLEKMNLNNPRPFHVVGKSPT